MRTIISASEMSFNAEQKKSDQRTGFFVVCNMTCACCKLGQAARHSQFFGIRRFGRRHRRQFVTVQNDRGWTIRRGLEPTQTARGRIHLCWKRRSACARRPPLFVQNCTGIQRHACHRIDGANLAVFGRSGACRVKTIHGPKRSS